MVQRHTPFAPGEFYHLYNRGNSKQVIYRDKADYQRFLALLHLANSTDLVRLDNLRQKKLNPFEVKIANRIVSIGAYSLMPNHYHLLISPITEDGVSQFMKKLGTGYSMYFNKRYKRSGALFEGPFKAKWADSDEYLKYLFSYIYLNPMKLHDQNWQNRKMDMDDFEFLRSFKYSSFYDLATTKPRSESIILSHKEFPSYFTSVYDPTLLADWFQQGQSLLK
jgi:putative transposase